MTPVSQPVTVPTRETHLRDYWRTVWQGRYTALAVFAITVALATGLSFLQKPQFRSTATVEIQPQARRLGPGQDVSGLGMTGYGWLAEERYQNTQLEIVRSRSVTEKAFQALNLRADPRFAASRDPVSVFGGMIHVAPRRETGLIEITVEGPDPDEAARWANAVADAFVKRNFDRAQDNARAAVNQLKDLMGGFRSDLSKAETQRLDMLKETEIYSPESQQAIVRLRLEKFNTELAQAQSDIGRLGSLLQKIQDLQASDGDPMTVPDLQQDLVLQELNKKKVQLEGELDSVKVTYRPGAPPYMQKLSELERVKGGVRDQIASIQGRIRNQYDLAKKSEASLTERIRTAEDEAFHLGLATSRYDLVKTDTDTKQQVFAAISKTMNEVSISAELLSNNVTILDTAVPATFPFKPSKKLNVFLGALIGGFLGLAVVFFLDYLDNTLRSPEDIEKYLGLTTIAVVPKYGPDELFSHAVNEAYQSLRTGLIFSSANRQKRVVLVTSTAPQEGKSSTAAQLAKTLAGAGDRVIIVDCDLRRPTQHVKLETDRDNGLTKYLVGAADAQDWRSVVKRDPDQPNLNIMTCGPIPPNPPELLGSDRFRNLIDELRSSFDWVIIDSPPAASLADAILLSALSDLVVLVVRYNVTDRDLIARTLQLLRNVSANVVGAVLNHVDLDRAYRKDQYYAGYYYTSKDAQDAKPGGVVSGRKVGSRA
jgi:capsular exopolysaccharide synthesis family protein